MTQTVKRSKLSNLHMVAGNEEKYPTVIHNDQLEEWVGIGWITIRPATDEDRLKFPTVIDDD